MNSPSFFPIWKTEVREHIHLNIRREVERKLRGSALKKDRPMWVLGKKRKVLRLFSFGYGAALHMIVLDQTDLTVEGL